MAEVAALVEYEAIADAAMATAVLTAARTIAGTYDPQGLDPFESARYAGELARVSDPMRLAIKKLSETRHEALLARLRQGASSADAANKAEAPSAQQPAKKKAKPTPVKKGTAVYTKLPAGAERFQVRNVYDGDTLTRKFYTIIGDDDKSCYALVTAGSHAITRNLLSLLK